MKTAIAFFLLSSLSVAQQLADAPKPKVFDAETRIELGVLGVSLAADGLSTERLLAFPRSCGPGCFHTWEYNPVARPFVYSGRGGTSAYFSLAYGADIGAVYWMRKHRRTRAARVFIFGSIAAESFLTVHNYQVVSRGQR